MKTKLFTSRIADKAVYRLASKTPPLPSSLLLDLRQARFNICLAQCILIKYLTIWRIALLKIKKTKILIKTNAERIFLYES